MVFQQAPLRCAFDVHDIYLRMYLWVSLKTDERPSRTKGVAWKSTASCEGTPTECILRSGGFGGSETDRQYSLCVLSAPGLPSDIGNVKSSEYPPQLLHAGSRTAHLAGSQVLLSGQGELRTCTVLTILAPLYDTCSFV
jgi:hypothetical protein